MILLLMVVSCVDSTRKGVTFADLGLIMVDDAEKQSLAVLTPFCCACTEDKDVDFYKQFQVIVMGLVSSFTASTQICLSR